MPREHLCSAERRCVIIAHDPWFDPDGNPKGSATRLARPGPALLLRQSSAAGGWTDQSYNGFQRTGFDPLQATR
jgi:hypothetical protein